MSAAASTKTAKKAKKEPERDEDDGEDDADEDEDAADRQQFDPLAQSLTSMEWLPRIHVGMGCRMHTHARTTRRTPSNT